MRTGFSITGVVGLALLVAGLMPGTASAEERKCRGSLGSITVDNLRVPEGATCTLTGTKVKGTIKVEDHARLYARGIRVIGNVQAEGAARVNVVSSSRVGGSVQAKQGGAAKVLDSRIVGDIQYDDNRRLLKANRNRVGGSIQVVENSGGVRIYGNVINGNLQCKQNYPKPLGGGNVVGVGALIDRGDPVRPPDLGVGLKALVHLEVGSWASEDCPKCKANEPIEDPGSRRLRG